MIVAALSALLFLIVPMSAAAPQTDAVTATGTASVDSVEPLSI